MKKYLLSFILISVFLISAVGVYAICEDSDGKDYYTKGYVTRGNVKRDDLCLSGIIVHEQLCTASGLMDSDNYGCSYGCSDGACLKAPACSDTCQSLGHECGTHTVCGLPFDCGMCAIGETCNNGKCIAPTCIDSDGGNNIYTKGKAYVGSATQNDCCTKGNQMPCSNDRDETWVIEGVCNAIGETSGIWMECPSSCIDGACLKAPEEVAEAPETKCWEIENNQCVEISCPRSCAVLSNCYLNLKECEAKLEVPVEELEYYYCCGSSTTDSDCSNWTWNKGSTCSAGLYNIWASCCLRTVEPKIGECPKDCINPEIIWTNGTEAEQSASWPWHDPTIACKCEAAEVQCKVNVDCKENEFCEFSVGTCKGPGICTEKPAGPLPLIYSPVCACDKKTYSNDYARKLAGISKKHEGKCAEKPKSSVDTNLRSMLAGKKTLTQVKLEQKVTGRTLIPQVKIKEEIRRNLEIKQKRIVKQMTGKKLQ